MFCLLMQLDLEPESPPVRQWHDYLTHERKSQTDQALKRSEFYVGQFKKIFRDHGVPEELVWLALVESGFKPSPRSPTGAQGMFQFKKETAEAFGLLVVEGKDERNHPFRAADACAKYLMYLFAKFESWDLVLAAYNLGEGDLRRRLSHGEGWNEVRHRLRPETEAYVPKVKAAAIIGNTYISQLATTKRRPVHEYVVKKQDTLYAIAKLFEIDIAILRELNGLDDNTIDIDQVIVIPVRE